MFKKNYIILETNDSNKNKKGFIAVFEAYLESAHRIQRKKISWLV